MPVNPGLQKPNQRRIHQPLVAARGPIVQTDKEDKLLRLQDQRTQDILGAGGEQIHRL